jgi:hypothetical protein
LTLRPGFLAVFCAGIASGFLFFAFLAIDTGGVLFIALPSLPLLLTGLGLGARRAVVAGLTGAAVAVLLTGTGGMVFFAAFIMLPAVYFIRRCLSWRLSPEGEQWYPISAILAELSGFAAAAALGLAMVTERHGGLKAIIPPGLAMSFGDPEFVALVQPLFTEWSFVLLAAVGWLWIVMIYAVAVLANAMLASKHYTLRPSLGLETGGLPLWLPGFLGLSGLLILLGQGADRYDGQVVFILLLLPYFLSGLSWVHRFSFTHRVPARKLWITCFYIAITFLRWPVLLVIGLGLYKQAAEMLDKYRKVR